MRKELSGIVERNAERKREQESGAGAADSEGGVQKPKTSNRVVENVLDHIVDMREYDVPYVMRCAIDTLTAQDGHLCLSNIFGVRDLRTVKRRNRDANGSQYIDQTDLVYPASTGPRPKLIFSCVEG